MQSLFLDSIRSEETRKKYEYGLKDFQKFVGSDNILKINIEESIIDYIIYLRKRVSSSTLHVRLAAVYHYYTMNDVILNKTKISKFKGEFIKVKKDRAYTHQEISKLLQIADLRMKVCILLMAGSGIRLGAIPDIKLRSLKDNVLTVYEGSSEEYTTFATHETLNYIKEYLDYRVRFGEKIVPEVHLIREQFNDFTAKKPRKITKMAIREIIWHLLKKAGLDNKEVQMTHGFRKFFTTQCINSKVNPEIREMLLGHKIGLASCYYRPTKEEMYLEYEKAIDSLTINEENRLRKKVEILTMDELRLVRLEKVVQRINRVVSSHQNLLDSV